MVESIQMMTIKHPHDNIGYEITLTIGMNFLGLVELTPGTSRVNFLFYLLASMLTITLYVFLNSQQTFVLRYILNISDGVSGNTNASLVFYDQLLSLLLLGVWGALSDMVGTRMIYVSGFAIMGVALVLYTWAENVYPQLLMLRFLYAVGAAASGCMVTAVISEYVAEKDKGAVAGSFEHLILICRLGGIVFWTGGVAFCPFSAATTKHSI